MSARSRIVVDVARDFFPFVVILVLGSWLVYSSVNVRYRPPATVTFEVCQSPEDSPPNVPCVWDDGTGDVVLILEPDTDE
jgi:hypothetical protein